MQTVLKTGLSFLVSITLVLGCCPTLAFATNTESDDSVLLSGSDSNEDGSKNASNDNSEASESDESADANDFDADQNVNGANSNSDEHNSSLDSSQDNAMVGSVSDSSDSSSNESDNAAPVENDENASQENSWRYVNGQHITSEQGASTDSLDSNNLISTYSAVINPDGFKVFNWFDRFSRGYYTGTDAYKGIDVSYHNGKIDWAKVKSSGVDYAIIRCGYGMDQRNQDDQQWMNNVRGCIENDIPFGVYLYSCATDVSRASSEADHVLRLLREAGLNPGDLAYPVYFDMEDKSTQNSNLAAIAQTFCNKIESAGYQVGIYANKAWFNELLTDKCFNNWTKWVAEWNASSGLTYKGLSNFTSGNGMWQFSDYGSVPGVGGACDLNYTFIEPKGIETIEDQYQAPSSPYERSLPDGDYVINTSLLNSSVLDIKSASKDSGANVQIYNYNKTDAQAFRLTYNTKNGFYSIVNKNSGKSLGLEKAANGSFSANVVQLASNSDDNSQKWVIARNSNGSYSLKNAINLNYSLAVDSSEATNGCNVLLEKTSNSTNQNWIPLNLHPSVSSERTISDGVYEICSSIDSGQVLDVEGASKDTAAAVQVYARNNTSAQRFVIQQTADGFYKITNLNSGLVLDVKSGNFILKTPIQQYTSNDSDAQKWAIQDNGNGTYTFISKLSGQVLDLASGSAVNKTKAQTYYSNQTAAQQFVLHCVTGEKCIEDGVYAVSSALNSTQVLDVQSASKSRGANIQLYASNQSLAQQFEFKYDTLTGFYKITNINSGLVLDVAGGNCENKANIQQYTSNDTLAQRWRLQRNDDGSIVIASALNNDYVLDVAGALGTSGTNVQLYLGNETTAQRWNIESKDYKPDKPAPVISEGVYTLKSALNNNYALDIAKASKEERANVQLYLQNGTKAQQFEVKFDPQTRLYTFINVNSGKALDVESGIAENKSNIQQYSCNNTLAQKWVISQNSDGTYSICSALDNKLALDVSGGTAQNGSNVQLYTSNDTPAQKWVFERS